MKDLCVPVPGFGDSEYAEITMTVGEKKQLINYRVESFLWESEEDNSHKSDEISTSLLRIERLKKAIKDYDKTWELIQIFTPAANSGSIQVLYRKKQA